MHAKFFFTKLDHIAISLVISKVRVKTFTTQDHENPRPTCPTFFDNAYRKKNAQVLPERELPDRSCHLVKIWSYSHTVIHIYKLYIIYMYLQGKFQGPTIVGPLFPYYSKGLLRIYIYIYTYLVKLLRRHATSPQKKVADEGKSTIFSGKSRFDRVRWNMIIWPDVYRHIYIYIYPGGVCHYIVQIEIHSVSSESMTLYWKC